MFAAFWLIRTLFLFHFYIYISFFIRPQTQLTQPDCLLCAPCTRKCFLWYLWTDCNTNCMPQLVLKTFSICPIKYPTGGASQLTSIYFDFWLSRNLPKLSTMDGTKIFFFPPPHINKCGKKSFTKTKWDFIFPEECSQKAWLLICYFNIRIFTIVALIYLITSGFFLQHFLFNSWNCVCVT